MANNTNKDLTELNTVNPLTAAANPNLTPKQVDMAATPAAKQGIAGIQSPFTNKGNVHQTPASVTDGQKSVFKTTTAPTEEPKQEKESGASDAERIRRLQLQRDVAESDRQAAQERLRGSTTLKQLGGVGDAIQSQLGARIDSLFTKDSGLEGEGIAAIAGNVELNKQFIAALPEENKTAASTAMKAIFDADKILDDPTRAGEHATVQQSMSKALADLSQAISPAGAVTDGKISWEQVSSFFPDKNQLLGTLVASGLGDQIKVDSQMMTDLGYDTDEEKTEITKLLGLTGNETYKEFSDKINNYLGTEYAEVTQLESKLRDPTLTADERRETLNSLRDLGYTGSLASREEVSALADEVEAVGEEDKIDFAGKEYTIAEALSDEVLTGAVADYLAGNLSAEDLPAGLVRFVEDNKKVFEAAVNDLKDEIGQYNTMQDEWKTLQALQLDPEVMKALGYNPDQKIQTTKLNAGSMPLISSILTGKDPDGKSIPVEKYKTFLTNVSKFPPAISQQVLTNLKASDLKRLSEDDNLQRSYVQTLTAVNNLSSIQARLDTATPDDDPSPEEILALTFGQKSDDGRLGDIGKLRGILDDISSLNAMGIGDFAGVRDAILAVGDVTDSKKLFEALKGSIGTSITNIDDFSAKLSGGIGKFLSAAGGAAGIEKYRGLIDSVKSGNPETLLSSAQSLGIVKGQDPVADINAITRLAGANPQMQGPLRTNIINNFIASKSANSDAVIAAQEAGKTHWTGEEARKQAVQGMSDMITLSTRPDAPEEAKAAARAKLKEYSKVFTERAEGMPWKDVIANSQALKGWNPPVNVPGYEDAFKGGNGFYPVKGGPAGDTSEFNPRSQDFIGAVMEYARMNKITDLRSAASQFAVFMNIVGGTGSAPKTTEQATQEMIARTKNAMLK